MKALSTLVIGFSLMLAASASAAPRCLDLTKKQADKAVTIAKVALNEGSSLLFKSSKESGMVKPLGIWSESKRQVIVHKAKGKSKKAKTRKIVVKNSYRVKVDGREVDISLVYIAKSPNDRNAFNLGWMAGCRPAPHKANIVRNWHQEESPALNDEMLAFISSEDK